MARRVRRQRGGAGRARPPDPGEPRAGSLTIDNQTLFLAAGASGLVALVALVVAGITIALFFGGAGRVYGPINDVFSAIALAALLLPIAAVDRIAGAGAGTWLQVVSLVAIAGAVVAAVGQLLLVAGVINLQASFVTGGIGIVPVLAWIVALVVLALPMGLLPASIGWTALAALGLTVVGSAVIAVTTGRLAWIAWTAAGMAWAAWLLVLSLELLDRANA